MQQIVFHDLNLYSLYTSTGSWINKSWLEMSCCCYGIENDFIGRGIALIYLQKVFEGQAYQIYDRNTHKSVKNTIVGLGCDCNPFQDYPNVVRRYLNPIFLMVILVRRLHWNYPQTKWLLDRPLERVIILNAPHFTSVVEKHKNMNVSTQINLYLFRDRKGAV